MGLLETRQRLPELIVVGSEQTFRLLEPIAEKLGVRMQQEEELPVLQFVLESLSRDL
jgi:sensor histidine kinase regulating citrate/malate metabolism